jgi:hypothetical protein
MKYCLYVYNYKHGDGAEVSGYIQQIKRRICVAYRKLFQTNIYNNFSL